MLASLKAGVWFAVAALFLNVIAYVVVLMSSYPYPFVTRVLSYLAFWPASLAQAGGASPSESAVLLLDLLGWGLVGVAIQRLYCTVYRHGRRSV
jgi:hypothetical protein